MSSLKGYLATQPGQVCLLQGFLYGFKQASRQWNVELSSKLHTYGFQQSCFDPCLFLQHTATSFLALLVYVDDVLIIGSHESTIVEAKHFLYSFFTIKDFDYAKYFLGLEIVRQPHGTYLNQRKYILDYLIDVGLSGAEPAATPLPKGPQFTATSGSLLPGLAPFRSLEGHLLYLSFTRPGIPYYNNSVSLSPLHASLIRMVPSMFSTSSRLLLKHEFFSSQYFPSFRGFFHADWAACSDSHWFVTGYCLFLDSALISWKTKKQSPYLNLQLRLNIAASPSPHVNCNGVHLCFKNLACLSIFPSSFIVTIRLPFTSSITPFS